jgi:glycine cleavage system H protein
MQKSLKLLSIREVSKYQYLNGEGIMNVPTDLRYAKTHEWIRLDGNKARMGITDYAQSELGDIVYVEPPEVGDEFAKGEELAMIDSAKTTAQIYAPVDCKVAGVNEKLGDKPELVNSDPYGEGYILELEVKNPSQAEELMDSTAYNDYVETGETE